MICDLAAINLESASQMVINWLNAHMGMGPVLRLPYFHSSLWTASWFIIAYAIYIQSSSRKWTPWYIYKSLGSTPLAIDTSRRSNINHITRNCSQLITRAGSPWVWGGGGGTTISILYRYYSAKSPFLAPLCHLAAELFKCRLVRRRRRRRRRRHQL